MTCKDCGGALAPLNKCTCWDRNLKMSRIVARLDNGRVVDKAQYHGVVRKDK